jgi:hypothetical protein
VSQVLVHRLAADTEVFGQQRLRLSRGGPAAEFGELTGNQGSLPPAVGAAQPSLGDALPLPLPRERPSPTAAASPSRCRVVAGECQVLRDELDPDALFGQATYQTPEVVEVAGQPVHRVHDHRVAVADEPEQRVELRPGIHVDSR